MASPSTLVPEADLTSFVGRRNDLIAVRRLFSVTRLVTLTGIGGVGKSRLALKAAHEMRRAFPDGVCVVEVSALKDPDLLPYVICDALGIRGVSASDQVTVLERHLHDRRMLVILDNCEHLVDAVAGLTDRLLRSAPQLSVLVTSRHALRVTGEHIYPVPPLLVPDPAGGLEPGDAVHYPSVQLFVERASAVVPDFEITSDNEDAVVRLCHRLEGIPLAIELASVRLRVLTVDDLADRLDDRFRELRASNRNLPKRHQTLQSLVDWSHDLCTAEEQLLWQRSAIFGGTFDEEGLLAVCTDDRLPASILLDTVAGLIDKSVLIREERAGHVRFRMLVTLSDYGRVKLEESDDPARFARRHRDWYLEFLERVEQEWAGPRQVEWADRIRLEHPNIRMALEYCTTTPGEVKPGLRMAALLWFWGSPDYFVESRLWLQRGLVLDHDPSPERARALVQLAYSGAFQSDGEALMTYVDQARELAEQIDDKTTRAFIYHVEAFLHSIGHDRDRSFPLFEKALGLYDELGMPAQYADSVRTEWAVALILTGRLDEASELERELRDRCLAEREQWNYSYSLWLRGMIALASGDPVGAEPPLAESIRLKRTLHDTLGIGLLLEVVSWTAVALGEFDRAGMIMGVADRIWQSVGARQLRGPHDHWEVIARKEIGDSRFEAAFARGKQLSLEEAVSFALRESVPTASFPAPDQGAGLTKRESEVVRLVASGMSNKEIAAKLVISPRTAEGHVEKILAKLGFGSRTQIAAWSLQHDIGQE